MFQQKGKKLSLARKHYQRHQEITLSGHFTSTTKGPCQAVHPGCKNWDLVVQFEASTAVTHSTMFKFFK